MSHLTEIDLEHLAKLCRLELTGEDKEKLLPQLDNILTFVKQLESCDTNDIDIVNRRGRIDSFGGEVFSSNMREKFLKNISHSIAHHSIEITAKLANMKK